VTLESSEIENPIENRTIHRVCLSGVASIHTIAAMLHMVPHTPHAIASLKIGVVDTNGAKGVPREKMKGAATVSDFFVRDGML
jgi:hypothetical protein